MEWFVVFIDLISNKYCNLAAQKIIIYTSPMKKTAFLFAFAFLFVSNLQAQEETTATSESKFGFKAGYSMLTARVSYQNSSASESASGFYVGALADMYLSNSFNFLTELIYARYSKDGSNSEVVFFPILLEYKFNDVVGLSTGPQLDYLISEGDGDGLKRLGFGVPIGFSFDITENVMFDLRYTFGISNRLNGNSIVNSGVKEVLNYFQVGLAYKI